MASCLFLSLWTSALGRASSSQNATPFTMEKVE
jgi:hypothetical protein